MFRLQTEDCGLRIWAARGVGVEWSVREWAVCTRDRPWPTEPPVGARNCELTMSLRLCAAFVVTCVSVAQGDVLLHRQAPGRTFGVSSDTSYLDDSGLPSGALHADTFSLSQSAELCRVKAFAFFGGTGVDDPEPPAAETVRIRFFADIVGLPSEPPIDEASFQNPTRTWTGQFINISLARKEYLYDIPLEQCVSLTAGIPYWIEFAQLGDQQSNMRWENANVAGGFAIQFPLGTGWHLSSPTRGQLAYELWTPEPGSGVLVGLVGLVLRRRGKCG